MKRLWACRKAAFIGVMGGGICNSGGDLMVLGPWARTVVAKLSADPLSWCFSAFLQKTNTFLSN